MKACLIAVAIVIVAGIGAVGASASAVTRSLTWHLVEKDAASNFIDNPPRQGNNAPPLIGDQLALRSEMLTRSGKHAGWLNAVCTVTTGGTRGVAPCHGVMSFKGGKLMLMAQISFTSDTADVAIVGGTGVYAGATGTIESVSRGESDLSDDTFHLVLP